MDKSGGESTASFWRKIAWLHKWLFCAEIVKTHFYCLFAWMRIQNPDFREFGVLAVCTKLKYAIPWFHEQRNQFWDFKETKATILGRFLSFLAQIFKIQVLFFLCGPDPKCLFVAHFVRHLCRQNGAQNRGPKKVRIARLHFLPARFVFLWPILSVIYVDKMGPKIGGPEKGSNRSFTFPSS